MAKKSSSQRGPKRKDAGKPIKKKTSILDLESVSYVDYKDVNLLRRFMSDRAKIKARRVTGNSAQQQSDVAMAIKVAREMALLPYSTRVTTSRGGRGDRGDRGPRGPRRDERTDTPTPSGPPPGPPSGDAPSIGDTAEAPVTNEVVGDEQVGEEQE
jgi:small subunit ribosomal protein S18